STLMPRSWELQVAIGAVCLAIGYGIGTFAGWCGQRLFPSALASHRDVIRRRSRFVLRAASILALLFCAPLWVYWQNAQRTFMGMTSVAWSDGVLIATLSPVAWRCWCSSADRSRGLSVRSSGSFDVTLRQP